MNIYNGWEIETDEKGIHHVNGESFTSATDAMDYAASLPRNDNVQL